MYKHFNKLHLLLSYNENRLKVPFFSVYTNKLQIYTHTCFNSYFPLFLVPIRPLYGKMIFKRP